MRYSSLPSLEEKFRNDAGNGEYTLRPFAVPVRGEQLTLQGLVCTPKNRSGYYHDVEHPKDQIILHFTAGQLVSDMSALTRNDFHVSVAFVVARDGTIYQLFPSKFWSGHIGKGVGNIGSGNAMDKRTVAIELSNYAFLTEHNGNLETYYSRAKNANGTVGPIDTYCALTETAAYQKLSDPFRGQSYYASFTKQQYQSTIILLRYLTAQYNIPRIFLPEPKRYETTDDVITFKGIVSHVNYRKDGKWDIGPAFDWKQVIEGVQAATFQPTLQRAAEATTFARSLDENLITSEEEIEKIVPKPLSAAKEDEEYEDLQRSAEDLEKGPKKKLYALLVGINEYRADLILEGKVRFPALRGCVEDTRKMQKYLTQEDSFDKKIEILLDQQATKEAIVKSFREHLSKAREGDVVLFYYSGHGTQEWADATAWKEETDGRLECIACYYDETAQDNFLLADKEIRFLIKELSKTNSHIVAIFDCCHSADNTRNGMQAVTAFNEVIEKRIPFSFQQRDWKNFVFGETISRDVVIQKGEANVLPEGLHVQFSACESDESAVEVSGEGVFTKTLLNVLSAAGGDVSYYALQNRVRQYLRNVYEQKPRIYIPGGTTSMLYSTFLNKPSTGNRTFAEVTYNASSGWQLNLGGIHGIGEKTKSITIIDPQSNKTFEAQIKSIGTDYSVLALRNALDTTKVYKGFVENLMAQTLQVNMSNEDGSPQQQQALSDALNTKGTNIAFEDDESKSQYVIRTRGGQFFITKPNDEFRPLVKPVPAGDNTAVGEFASHLKQIAQWEFLRNLSNQDKNTTIGKDGLQIELFQVDPEGNKTVLDPTKDAIFNYKRSSNSWKTAVQMKLTNRTDHNLYCAVLHLTSSFGSSLKLLNPNVKMLEPGNSVELSFKGNSILESTLSDVVKTYNWKEEVEYFKVIISTELFNAEQHALNELPTPPVPDRTRTINRGFAEEKDVDTEVQQGWTTQLITLRLQNPEYNKVREKDLEIYLGDEDIADFAMGIYFDAIVNEKREPQLNVKAGITLIPEGELEAKGIVQEKIIDAANWLARGKRNRNYREMIKQFPDRLRIVSEGDSWFQHPLVLDIIDHLSRVYAIYCVAAAGDTLRNYLSKEKTNGEYFLDAIEVEKPAFFLLSGGGNDILGSQFRTYLNDNPDQAEPEGQNPKRFLKQAIFDELKSLMDIYRQLFNHIQTHKPQLQILVHGYDYPVKLNDAKKGWLGRYMIEKGISRPKDRLAIIRLIMDTFNAELEEVAKDFDNVSYIDVRNIVRFNEVDKVDQWYDEIHPNNDGFQQVAMKFMAVIDKIYKEKFSLKSPPPPPQSPPAPRDVDVARGGPVKRGVPKMESGAPSDELESFSVPTPRKDKKAKRPVSAEEKSAAPFSDVRDGQLEYEIPDLMEIGKSNMCKVRVAGEEVALDFLKISSKSINEKIKVSDEMMVKLLDPSGGENFDITSLNNDWQGIFTDQFTEWNFNVKPKKAGKFPLVLRISIKTDGRSKDTNILEKEVLVSKNAAEQPASIKKILFMCANPDDTERLKVNKESERIKEALDNAIHGNEILVVTNMAATPSNMIKYLLREKPTFVHFSGHGDKDGLYVEDENGRSKQIPETALDLIFKNFKDVQCVFFNSCYSEALGKGLTKYIPHVIGMTQAVKDRAANAFSVGFYQAIGAGEEIKPAFDIGLASMIIEDPGQSVAVILPEG